MGVSLNRAASRISLVIFALAVAGLVAFGDSQASASHVSCGDTITADTTLDSDLLNCPNNGIVIGADGDHSRPERSRDRRRRDPELAGCDPKSSSATSGSATTATIGVTIKGGTRQGLRSRAC